MVFIFSNSPTHEPSENAWVHQKLLFARKQSNSLEGSAALVAALSQIPAHEEKCNDLVSMLEQTEREARGEIAEAARSTAALRYNMNQHERQKREATLGMAGPQDKRGLDMKRHRQAAKKQYARMLAPASLHRWSAK